MIVASLGKPRAWAAWPAEICDRLAWAVLAALTLLALATFRHYGNGFDAEVQDIYGRQVLTWFTSLGADSAALRYLDLYYYGGLFDLLAALANLVSPFGHWATRHLLEALAGLAGLAGAWRLGRRVGGPAVGVASLVLLAMMPSYYGMMFINPKDIPFAAAMVWAILAMTRLIEDLENPSWQRILGFGVAAGFSLGMRVGGILLFAYLGLILAADLAIDPERRLAKASRYCCKIGVPTLVVAWVIMLAAWPWAQISPILHPFAAVRHFTGMGNDIDTLYFGHEVGRRYHPPFYLPVYLVLKLPDIILALLVAGAVPAIGSLRRGIPQRLQPLLIAIAFPILYAVVSDPELYDAERHFLFLLPPIAVLAGLAGQRLVSRVQRPTAIMLFLTLSGAGCLWQIRQMADLHPYEYAFFNDLIGGTRGAENQFETEYWGASLTEASLDLSHYIRTHHLARAKPWRVAVCGHPSQMGDLPDSNLVPTTDWRSADFFVSTTRGGCDRRMPGRKIDAVERDGVTFAIVKDMRPALSANGEKTGPDSAARTGSGENFVRTSPRRLRRPFVAPPDRR